MAREEINRLREARIKRFDEGPQFAQANEQEQQDENNGLLVFQKAEDGSKLLKAGTAEKLIERLTSSHTHGTPIFGHPALNNPVNSLITIFPRFGVPSSFLVDLQILHVQPAFA